MELQDWGRVAALTQGGLLQDFEVPGAHRLNDWLDEQRQLYRDLINDVAERIQLDHMETINTSADMLRGRTSTTYSHDPLPADSDGPATPLEAGVSDLPPRFVGRQSEMTTLEGAYSRSLRAGFTAIAIDGEPGIGKSALTRRFARLRAIRGSRVLMARGFPAERNLPFGVIAQWVRGIGDGDVPMLGSPWMDILTEAFPGVLSTDDSYPSQASTTDALRSEYRLLDALRHLLSAVAEKSPLVLVLDDAHMSDAASLGFVHYLGRRSNEARILFVATVRTPSVYGAEPFDGWAQLNRLLLKPLARHDIGALIAGLLKHGAPTPSEVVDDLCRRTGGNPLLLVSLLGTDYWDGTRDVPESVLKFFVPRLRALSSDAAIVLAAMSIAGESTDLDRAARIAGVAPDSTRLAEALVELETAALVVKEEVGIVRLKHGIVAEVALSSLGEADRRALFGRAARILGSDGSSPAAVVAVHHDIAGDRARAYEAALKAASASRELYATREQEFFLKLALSNAPNADSAAYMRIDLANLFLRLGRLKEGLEIVSEESLLTAPPSVRSRAEACRLALELTTIASPSPHSQVWRQIEDLSGQVEQQVIAELYLLYASVARDLGDRDTTMAAANRALDIVNGIAFSPQTVIVAARAGALLGMSSDASAGLKTVIELLGYAESNAEVLGQCLSAEAALLVSLGKLNEAEGKFAQAMELAERCCMYDALFALRNNLGICYTELGKYSEAERQFEEAVRLGDELRGTQRSTLVADNLAMLHLERGEYELALRTVRGAMTSTSSRSPRELFHRHALIGLCSLELGLLAQAFEAKREIDLLLQQHEYWGSDASYVETFLARMLVMEGRPNEARERLEAAVEVYRLRDLMCRARLELELVRLDLKGEPARALARAESMLETLRGTGARPLLDRFEELADRARRHAR